MRKQLALVALVVVMAFGAMGQSGCDRSSADNQQSAQTRELQQQSNNTVGMPGITNFTEKQIVSDLYTLRDQQDLITYTYVVDMQGRLWHVCDSTGYGVPFSAQFSNPQRPYRTGAGVTTMPQPEPNGLWVPESSSATWVICASDEGSFQPMYVEPSIIVSSFPLRAVGSYNSVD